MIAKASPFWRILFPRGYVSTLSYTIKGSHSFDETEFVGFSDDGRGPLSSPSRGRSAPTRWFGALSAVRNLSLPVGALPLARFAVRCGRTLSSTLFRPGSRIWVNPFKRY